MKIQEACRLAGVTRKAALVAAEQGLLAPARLENGYRDFSSEDVTRLRKIAVLRGLGMTGEEIREYFAGDQAALSRAAMAGHLRQEREAVRQRALEELARTGDWEAARAALEALQALGYTPAEARNAVQSVRDQSDKTDELIKLALRSMAGM